MGFRYRKSKNLGGGFRVNLSKSGIGYSWGTKGFRVTKTARGNIRTTAYIPGTGISYVKEQSLNSILNSPRHETTNKQYDNYSSGGTEHLKNHCETDGYTSSMADAALWQVRSNETDALNEAYVKYGEVDKKSFRAMMISALITLLGPIIVFFTSIIIGSIFDVDEDLLYGSIFSLMSITTVVGLISLAICQRIHNNNRYPIYKANYSFDAASLLNYKVFLKRFEDILESSLVAQIVSHDDAQIPHISAIGQISMEKGHWKGMECNVPSLHLSFDHWPFVFIDILPDKLFVGHYTSKTNKFGIVKLENLVVEYNDATSNSSACGYTPWDTNILRSVWRYRNKDGSRDLRYKNNFEISWFECAEVIIKSEVNRFELRLIISNKEKAQKLCNAIEHYINLFFSPSKS